MSNYSPAPGTPQTGTKAVVAAVVSAVVAFIMYWVVDPGAFTGADVVEALVAAVLASGLTGVPTYVIPNRTK
jgi:hypothetical protein